MKLFLSGIKKQISEHGWILLGMFVGALLSISTAAITVNKEAVGSGKVTVQDVCVIQDKACLSSPNCQEKAPGFQTGSCNCPCLLVLPEIIPFGQRLNQLVKQYLFVGISGGFAVGAIIGGYIADKKKKRVALLEKERLEKAVKQTDIIPNGTTQVIFFRKTPKYPTKSH